MNALHTLEETAWQIKPEDIEEIRRKENWKVWQDIDPKVFTADCDVSLDMAVCLTKNAYRAEKMAITFLALFNTASNIQKQLERTIRQKLKSILTKLLKGISSLPDELLAQIFVLAVSPHDKKQAVRLSHVSRRFRRVALAETRLWGTIHLNDVWTSEFYTFLARSGQNSDLHIVAREGRHDSNIRELLDECWPVASRWKSLTVTLEQYNTAHLNSVNFTKVDDILKLVDGNKRLRLERLEELQVTDHLSSERIAALFEPETGSDETFIPSWTTPNLRILRFKDYVPSPAPIFASVTSFTLSIRVYAYTFARRIGYLLSFLAETPTITELSLVFEHGASFVPRTEEEVELPDGVSCPSLTSLSLQFSSFGIGRQGIHFVSTFMGVLWIPNLQQLSVSISFLYMYIVHPGFRGEVGFGLLDDLSRALLPSSYTWSQLSSLSYKFELDPAGWEFHSTKCDVSTYRSAFTIPLDRVPNLSSLTMTTFTRIRFCRDGSFVPCGFREFHLQECNEMDGESFQESIESLREAGAWEAVESVTVKNCKKLDYEIALHAVGNQRLVFLET